MHHLGGLRNTVRWGLNQVLLQVQRARYLVQRARPYGFGNGPYVANGRVYYNGKPLSIQGGSGHLDRALKFRAYIRDIEAQTGVKIGRKQLSLLKQAVRENNLRKLSPQQIRRARYEFERVRNDLIREWELNRGEEWPRYKAPVYSKTGIKLRDVGDYYDAHHIWPLQLGGPATWLSIHPAAYPGQHQGGIHRAGGILTELLRTMTRF